MVRRPANDREIDLSEADIGPSDDVLETRGAPSPPPPLRLFAGLPAPAEVPYARAADDPTSLASLWRAIGSL